MDEISVTSPTADETAAKVAEVKAEAFVSKCSVTWTGYVSALEQASGETLLKTEWTEEVTIAHDSGFKGDGTGNNGITECFFCDEDSCSYIVVESTAVAAVGATPASVSKKISYTKTGARPSTLPQTADVNPWSPTFEDLVTAGNGVKSTLDFDDLNSYQAPDCQ